MDIAKVSTSNFPLKITHPATGKYIGLTVVLAPTYDPRFKAVERSITDKTLTKRVRGKVPKADELDENRNKLIASVVVELIWENGDDGKPGSFGGEQLAMTPENVAKLLSVEWLRDQIDEALADQSNFFKG